MERTGWWHGAVLATAAVLVALVVVTAGTAWQVTLGIVAIASFVVVWFVIGRDADRSVARAVGFATALVVIGAVGAVATPALATFQTIAYPLIWTRARTTRSALVATIAMAVGVGVGWAAFLVGVGGGPTAYAQIIVVQSISLAFSIAFGLWITQIAERSEERQRLIDELRVAQERLAAVSRDAGVSSERERLAREIHDTIAQDLTGLVLLTQRARRELAAGATDALDAQLALLEESARATLAETRGLVAATASIGPANAGIGEALDRLGDRFARETGLAVAVDARELPNLDRDTEVVLLRCAQEGLANVRKHAKAASASVTVACDGDIVTLSVRDDGGGFDPGTANGGFGLAGMRERLALVDGSLAVESGTGGTTITVSLPLGVRT